MKMISLAILVTVNLVKVTETGSLSLRRLEVLIPLYVRCNSRV
jgi:hypothetical protein